MKFVLGLVAPCLLFALVYAEDCLTTDDCTVTQCAGGNSVVCELPNSGGTGKCTCAMADACSDRNDCYSPAHPELDCSDAQRHCYDSACVCSRFEGGGSIGGWPGGIGGGFP